MKTTNIKFNHDKSIELRKQKDLDILYLELEKRYNLYLCKNSVLFNIEDWVKITKNNYEDIKQLMQLMDINEFDYIS